MRTSIFFVFAIILSLTAIGFADPKMPWNLRNHYTFDAKNSSFEYAEDNGAWRVLLGTTELIKEANYDITLGDGTVISNIDLGQGASSRDVMEAFLGKGFEYTVTFNELKGLKVVHAARTIEGRPFVMVEISITNTSPNPITLKNVRPVIIGEGAVMNFGADALARNRHLTSQGGMAIFDKAASPSMSIFHSPSLNATIGVYVFDKSQSDAFVRFQPAGNTWSGDVICSYEPGMVIQPGQKITTDPVVVVFGYPSPNKMEMYTAWAYGTLMTRDKVKEGPRAFASAPEGASLDAVLATGRAWKGDGVKHALVPFGWEEKPGAMNGANGYPKNMGGAASSLSKEGLVPGLTIDPLPVEKDKGGCVAGSDGVLWANPANPDGAAAIAARLREALKWDFTFFALAPTKAPDSVLAQMGISRAQANNLAFDVAVGVFEAVPVFPAGGQVIPPTLDALLEAASAAGRIKVYGGRFAPLRIDLDAGGQADDNLGLALRFWPGPIELLGDAKGGVQQALASGIPMAAYAVGAVDLHHTVSHVWQYMSTSPKKNTTPFGTAITIFPGAQFWHKEDIDFEKETEARLWDPKSGKFLGGDAVPAASGELQTIGAIPVVDHPVMLGVAGTPTLSLEKLDGHIWDAATSTLKGSFIGGATGDAFVYVPAPWKFKSGEAGKNKVRGEAEGEIIKFEMSGASANFELLFEK